MICKKVKFDTKINADLYIAKLRRTSNRDKIPKRSYLCPHCRCWHLTSQQSYESLIIEDLKKQIGDLIEKHKKELQDLKNENQAIKQGANKQENIAVKTDTRIQQLNKAINEKNRVISKLREDNSDLISRNIQLKKLIDAQSTTNNQPGPGAA